MPHEAAREWAEALQAKQAAGLTRQQAAVAIQRENPRLWARYIVETNENIGRHAAVAHLRKEWNIQ